MKTLTTSVSSILLPFTFLFFVSFLSEQVFAGFRIHVVGAVQSYKNGMYQIKTNKALINIQDSKLTSDLRKEINRRIGRRIQMGIPFEAIFSYKKFNENHRI